MFDEQAARADVSNLPRLNSSFSSKNEPFDRGREYRSVALGRLDQITLRGTPASKCSNRPSRKRATPLSSVPAINLRRLFQTN
jgi:hypothetical protein